MPTGRGFRLEKRLAVRAGATYRENRIRRQAPERTSKHIAGNRRKRHGPHRGHRAGADRAAFATVRRRPRPAAAGVLRVVAGDARRPPGAGPRRAASIFRPGVFARNHPGRRYTKRHRETRRTATTIHRTVSMRRFASRNGHPAEAGGGGLRRQPARVAASMPDRPAAGIRLRPERRCAPSPAATPPPRPGPPRRGRTGGGTTTHASVAQQAEAPARGAGGCGFESRRTYEHRAFRGSRRTAGARKEGRRSPETRPSRQRWPG